MKIHSNSLIVFAQCKLQIPKRYTKFYDTFKTHETILLVIKILCLFQIILFIELQSSIGQLSLEFIKESVGDDIKKNRMFFKKCNMVIMQQKYEV